MGVHSSTDLLKSMMPKASPVQLIRIGGEHDGAYLIPDDFDGIDACFSPGVNNFKHFEDELTKQFGVKCHMCDYSSDLDNFETPLIANMQTFQKKWLDVDGAENSISLEDWVAQYSPDPRDDLILQMDIEGAEYRNLLSAKDSVIDRFRIIVIELHGLGAFRQPNLLDKEVGPLLQKLSATHICVHAHPNNCCGDYLDNATGMNVPNIIELTYLRRDRFAGEEGSFFEPQLPHPLDISWNIRANPPIHLNEKWLLTKQRSIESQLKVLRDNLDFADWERSALRAEVVDTNTINQLAIRNLYNSLRIESGSASTPKSSELETRVDLAKGKTFRLSQGHGHYPSEGKVEEQPKFFFHTAIAADQSITIDLEQSYALQYLVIKNRLDGLQERARHIFVSVSDEPFYSIDSMYPINFSPDFLKPKGPASVTPLLGRKGRYLSIYSPMRTALHFSSIKIYA